MRLRTNLQLSAVLLVVVPLPLMLALRWAFGNVFGTDELDLALMAALMLVSVAAATVVVYHRFKVINRIRLLNAWTESVLAGNLDAKVTIPQGDDETARLARALETMVAHIKSSYADLHRTHLRYKQRAETNEQRAMASQMGAKHLSEALMRMKDSHVKTLNEERLKALEQVAKGVTHDFSEALTPIMATTDLLLARPELLGDQEKLLEHIRSIRKSAEQGRAVIRHLAGFFHQIPVSPGTVDVNRAVRIAIEQVESLWRTRQDSTVNRKSFQTKLGALPPIAGNEDDIREAVACLITNALEAMPDGGTATVVTRTAPSAVVIEVSDTGKGMEDNVKARATEPFFSTKGEPHNGMGLTLAASAARSHGGEIKLESEAGAGTKVTLTLPAKQTSAAGTVRLIATPPTIPEKLTVIVADDDRSTREVIAFAINSSGHRAVAVPDAEQCLAKMRDTRYDIAVIDYAMPGMRGDELASIIARTYPETAVIMLTGYGDIMAEQNEAPDFVDILLPKPISANELLTVLKKVPQVHWENKHRPKRITQIARPPQQPVPRHQAARTFTWEG
jgi:signal transduction histidine kinase/CheY-like chemotaxis protein